MLRLFTLCLLLASCHSVPAAPYRPIGSELFANPAFAAWTRGTPRSGGFGHNALSEQRGDIDTADRWVGKWAAKSTSRLTASKDPAGMRYDMRPAAPESYYVRQYIGDANWFYSKKIRLTTTFQCSANVTRVWYYLHFRWNNNQEDNPGVTVLSQSGSLADGKLTTDVLMPPRNTGYRLDASAGFVPSLNIDTSAVSWCVIHSMSAKQIP